MESQANENEQTEPLRLFKLVVQYPLLCFGVTLCYHLALVATTAGLYFTGKNVFAEDFENLPLFLNQESVHLRDLAWRGRNDFNNSLQRIIISRFKPWWLRGYAFDYLELIYELNNGNVLTSHHLQTIKTIESNITSFEKYSAHLCQLNYDQSCVKPISVLRFFDGTYQKLDPVFLDPNFENIAMVVSKANFYNETKPYVKLLIGSDSQISELNAQASVVRTRLPLGGPLSYNGSRAQHETTYKRFYLDILQPYLDRIKETTEGEFKLYYIGRQLFINDLRKQALLDLMFAIGSLSFIFLYMWIHTESLWITFWATMSIVSSFLGTNLFYRYVLQYEYFGLFHILSVFIILGIGADDIFIFFDTWRLNCKKSFPSDAHRFAETYRKSARAMFVTSLTTAVAFLVSGLSPLLAVSSFGIFSGCLVIINYLSVVTFFPTAVAVYSLRIIPLLNGFFARLASTRRLEERAQEVENEIHDNPVFDPVHENWDNYFTDDEGGIHSTNGTVPGVLPNVSGQQLVSIDAVIESGSPSENNEDTLHNMNGYSCTITSAPVITTRGNGSPNTERIYTPSHERLLYLLSGFFKNQYFWFITRKPVKIATPLIFLALIVVFAVYAFRVRPDEEQVRVFRSSHNYGRALHLQNYAFVANGDDELTRVRMAWGLKERDLGSCNSKSSEECDGRAVFDDQFSFSTAEDQRTMLNVCKRLKALSQDEIDALRIKRNLFTNEPEIACFMDAIQDFFWKEKDKLDWREKRVYPENVTFNFPLSDEDINSLLSTKLSFIPVQDMDIFNRRIELAIAYWMTNGFTLVATDDYFTYGGLVGEIVTEGTTSNRQFNALSFGASIKYLGIEFNTTMYVNTLGYEEGLPIYAKWDELMQDVLKDMPDHLSRGFQSTRNTWHWLKVQQSLTNSAISGIIIGLCLAVPILILTTLNVIIGFLAALTIALITVCVVGMIPMVGWKLGVLESLNLCLVVGLSVDYVVHLAEAYHRCPFGDRARRVQYMLESVGTSVLSGAITTFGASIFMLFAQIQFLFQFGIFMLSTIGFSILFSLLGFTILLLICGPQNETGSLTALWRRGKQSGRKKGKLTISEQSDRISQTASEVESSSTYTQNTNYM